MVAAPQIKRSIYIIISFAAVLLASSCTSVNHVARQVADKFIELHDAGKLPGIAPTDSLEETHIEAFPQNYRITYPASVSVYAIKAHDETVYIYTFTKETADSLWRLTSAARRTQDGGREDLKIDSGQGKEARYSRGFRYDTRTA